jgi:hypothetical protein
MASDIADLWKYHGAKYFCHDPRDFKRSKDRREKDIVKFEGQETFRW